MINKKLKDFLNNRCCTLLGVGPMSKNCVDATIELANNHNIPIFLIASRRQIDSEALGGGYVNNWNTSEFSKYVLSKDKKRNIILSRDHGGPWQNNSEVNSSLNLKEAMQSAKSSYKEDIKSNFEILHLDPSIDIHNKPKLSDTLDRLFELYEFCWAESKRQKKEITFEVGTEEQSGSTNTQEELDYTLNAIKKFCKTNKIPLPSFVVIQAGTRVKETRNVGSFDSPFRVFNELPPEIQIPKMIEICNKYGMMMKAHNTDYLSDEGLVWHPRLGIHAANVAPEFGVKESIALIKFLNNNGLQKYTERFLEISYNSKKWEKWMLPNTKATDEQKSIIAGHYIFSNNEFLQLKEEIHSELGEEKDRLDVFLKSEIKKSINRYLYNFRLISSKS